MTGTTVSGTPGAAMMLTVAHTTLVGRRHCGSNPRYPPPNWRIGKMPSRKADQNGCNMDMRDEDQAITNAHVTSVICITWRGRIKGQSRDTTEMYPGKVMHIIGG